ncbi:MAG: hypothetical protein CMB76_08755 [Euryarchaeota archaeon]|nr:hypothetical protein [Euryarchaeota archaeon]|tara:strand:- start:2819 stop:5008 length:2190 start_codon:yes stop_codon:yes gene_type:complete
MTAGRLAASKPGATTNTVLYRTPIDKSASTVLNVCNQSGSGVSYRAALRDYEQVLHLDGLNTSAYKFAKGNPISAYKINVEPGFQDSAAIPGTTFTTTNGATATILDVFKPTNDVDYFVKVLPISGTAIDGDNLAGTLIGGETLTGATSGFTATFRGMNATIAVWTEYAEIAAGGTTVNISRTTGLADGMYLTGVGTNLATLQDGEVMSINSSGINTTTNVLQLSRGQLGSTAAAIPAGSQINAWSASATVSTIAEGATYVAGDNVLTVANSTGFTSGSIVIVDNELMQISEVNGNDLSVVRGRYGTTDVDHNDGVNVTLLTDNGIYLLNYFSEGETVTGSQSNATVALNFNTAQGATIDTKYVLSTTSVGATDHIIQTINTYDLNRTYKYNLEDSTCTNYPLKFSGDDPEGTNGSGTEYTAGVSKVGTAGSSGAYTSIDITSDTQANLNVYADGSPAGSTTGIGFVANVNDNPSYNEIYIYDVKGEVLAAADTFTISATTQTIQQSGITVGPFGYVQDWYPASCHLKVTIGEGSEAFAANDAFYDTPTLNNGVRHLTTARTGKALTINNIGGADASRSAGTYTNISPNSTGGSGDIATTKVTIVVDGSGAATITLLNGGYGHAGSDTLTVNDSQLGGGGGAALTFDVNTISTAIHTDQTEVYSTEDYFFYGKAVAANITDKNSSIIVGPGQNLLVYSSAGDISYVLNGFETTSDDYTVVNMTKIQSGG